MTTAVLSFGIKKNSGQDKTAPTVWVDKTGWLTQASRGATGSRLFYLELLWCFTSFFETRAVHVGDLDGTERLQTNIPGKRCNCLVCVYVAYIGLEDACHFSSATYLIGMDLVSVWFLFGFGWFCSAVWFVHYHLIMRDSPFHLSDDFVGPYACWLDAQEDVGEFVRAYDIDIGMERFLLLFYIVHLHWLFVFNRTDMGMGMVFVRFLGCVCFLFDFLWSGLWVHLFGVDIL